MFLDPAPDSLPTKQTDYIQCDTILEGIPDFGNDLAKMEEKLE
jgi:hypothetical protein